MSARVGITLRQVVATVLGLLLAAGVMSATPTSARADSAPPDPANPATPTTVTADPLPTVQIDGIVWSQVVVGNTVYAAGKFSNARPAGAAPGTQQVVRNNLLAYDIRTGELVQSFAPDLNAQALVVTASPDGSRIYVGGDFTRANGQTRYRVAAYSTATGQLVDSFRPAVAAQVRAIVATDTTVYLGGWFGAVGSTARNKLAAVRASDGGLLPWAPQPGVGSTAGNNLPGGNNTATSNDVLAMAPGANGQIVVGGRFDSLNGVKATGVGAVDGVTGATRPFAVNQLITNQGVNSAVWSLTTDGTTVYGTAYDYGGPGNIEGAFAAAADGGALNWANTCRGDSYSSFPMNGAVYIAGHPHDCSSIGGYPEQSPQVWQFGTAVSRVATGTSTSTWKNSNFLNKPAPSLLPWFPSFQAGNVSGAWQAGWSVSGNDSYVVYGGEFLRVNGVPQQGLVRFAGSELAPDKVAPWVDSGITPTVSMVPGAVRVSWRATSDRDNEQLTYKVYRDAVTPTPVCEVTRPSTWWNRPTYACSDTGATAGAHRYLVIAFDPWGNRQPSSWVAATVGAANSSPARVYADLVEDDGALHHWPLGEASGALTYDRTDQRDMTVNSGVTRGQEGAVAGDADTAFSFNGASNGFLSTGTAVPGPQTFSVEAWFQTTTRDGGQVVGFGNASTGMSGSYDRHVYMDAAGRLTFGVYNGAMQALTTSGAYNDGRWHHVVGTLDRTGMAFFVDGTLVGKRTTVTSAQRYNGFWRVGGDRTWVSGADWFAGRIDEVAVYPRALSAQDVAEHTAAGRTGEAPNVAPTASFTASGSDLTGSFDGTGSTDPDGSVTAHAWDFGDGSTGTGATVTHTYAVAGTYTVTLTVTDDDGATATTTREITVAPPPVGPGSVAADAFGRQTASGWGAADRGGAWTVVGGLANASVTGGAGRLNGTAGRLMQATLGAVSQQDISAQVGLVLPEAPTGGGLYVSLGARRVGTSDYRATLHYLATGDVDVRLDRYVEGTGTVLGSVRLPTRPTPGTSLTVRLEVTGTAPATLRVKVWATGTPEPSAWTLTRTDGTVALQVPGAIHVLAYTSATATRATSLLVDDLRAEPAGTVVEQPQEPAPNQVPVAAFTSSAEALTVSVDGSGSTDADGQVVTHGWDFGDGGTGTGTTASHTYAAAGTYQVRLTVTDDDGAVGTTTRTVTVTAPEPDPDPAVPALAADAFGREVASGWGTADVGGNWLSYGGAGAVAVTAGSARANPAPGTSAGGVLAVSVQDAVVQAEVVLDRAPTGSGTWVALGTRDVGGTRYKAQLWFAADGRVQLGLLRVVDWSETWLTGQNLPGTYTPGTVLTLRFEVGGTAPATLRAKVWAEGSPEPEWQVTATDVTAVLQRPGRLRVDVYTGRSGTASSAVRIDDVWMGAAGQAPPAG